MFGYVYKMDEDGIHIKHRNIASKVNRDTEELVIVLCENLPIKASYFQSTKGSYLQNETTNSISSLPNRSKPLTQILDEM